MVVENMVPSGVSVDEANILADFFNLQADKHGPEMLKKLSNIGTDKAGSESLRQQNHREQRHIKIEVEAENVFRNEIDLGQGINAKSPDPRLSSHLGDSPQAVAPSSSQGAPVSFLVQNNDSDSANRQVQYLMSADGKLIPFLPEMILKSLLNPSPDHPQNQVRLVTSAKTGVSVIQRAPPKLLQATGAGTGGNFAKIELNNPNIILERRVHNSGPHSGQETEAVASILAETRHPQHQARRQIDTRAGAVSSQNTSTPTLSLVTSISQPVSGVKGKKSNQQQSDHLICEVCGERAGKHSYYGGQVCPSCRAFFRRSVQSRYNETFKCTKGKEDCLINLLTRKNCQYCRYQKCLGAGMRPSWILSEEERVRRFHGRNPKPEKINNSKKGSRSVPVAKSPKHVQEADMEEPMLCDDDSSSVGGHSTPESVESLTNSSNDVDKDFILKLIKMIYRVCSSRHDDIPTSVLSDILQVTINGTSMSQSTASHLDDIISSRSQTCLQMLPEFKTLSSRDQEAILEHNLPLVHRFRQALCLHAPQMGWSKMIEFLIGQERLQEEVDNLPTDLSGSPKKQFQYQSLFSFPWCQSKEIESLHKTLMEDIASWVDFHDEIQIVLLALILAFNHDFLDLEGRNQVEKIQLKYVILLQSHLRSLYPNSLAASKLTKAVMLPAVAREIVQITKKRFII